jgi:hypothetical protein
MKSSRKGVLIAKGPKLLMSLLTMNFLSQHGFLILIPGTNLSTTGTVKATTLFPISQSRKQTILTTPDIREGKA